MQDVLDLLQFTPVTRNGRQWRGGCPVHGSQSPQSRSFSVNLAQNAYQCFSCGSKGNQLDLWSAATSQSLVDAAKDLCKRMNIETPLIQ